MFKLIDGRKIARELLDEMIPQIQLLERKPGLAFILVGENPASQAYVKAKKKTCHELQMVSTVIQLSSSVAQSDLLRQIDALNSDPLIDGILIQLPLPPHINSSAVICAIDPMKDVDGFHPINVGKLLLGEEDGFYPCTPDGIRVLLQRSNIPIQGKHVVILGRSNIVGKPLAALLMQNKPDCNATVTIAHRQSHNLSALVHSADVIVAAMGQPKFITQEMVKPKCVIIDVGINRVGDQIVGDVDFEHVAPLTSFITPVPGGVGPMTIAMLMRNTLKSCLCRR